MSLWQKYIKTTINKYGLIPIEQQYLLYDTRR